MLGLRILAGIPVAFIFAPAAFLVARAFEKTPGRAVGLFLSAPPAGGALGNLLSPSIAAHFGWPWVLVAFNVPLLALGPVFVLTAKHMPSRRTEPFGLRDFLAAFPRLGGAGIPLLVACGFLAQFPFSVYYLFSTQILPPKFQGTAYAFNNTVSIIGGAISPALAGYLVDVTGSFLAAFLMIAASSLLGIGLLFAIRER